MEKVSSHRQEIYARYATNFQDSPLTFDESGACRWAKAAEYYLHGLLPAEKDAKIVDLACGRGWLLYFFQKKGYKNLKGVDISPEQIEISRQVVSDVEERDVLDFLKQHSEEFSLITAFDLVEHFQKPEALEFLKLCHTSLKPGGRLILHTPNADSPFGMASRYGDFTHEIGFNVNSLLRLMRLTGFTQIEARETGPVPYGYSIASSLRFILWQAIRFLITTWNLVETGGRESKILTRNFLITGTK